MSKRLVVEDEARAELRDAVRHYESERAGLGGELLDVVEGAFDGLSNGTAAPVTVPDIPNELGIRRILLERFPFAVVYVEELGVVHILAIAHLRREPTYWLRRVRSRSGDR